MYRSLKASKIVETAEKLSRRIMERFPASGLSQVSQALVETAGQASLTSQRLTQPIGWLRALVAGGVLILMGVLATVCYSTSWKDETPSIFEFVQAVEAGINDIIFIGLAIFFLATWENRLKRKCALRALHELRSLAHIIDMHQLTKDPERLAHPENNTASSPSRNLDAFSLTRYLDYCSEMLAIISKIAALYVQDFDDSETLSTVNEIENLTSGLSRKIWQKIMILDRIVARSQVPTP
jgi:hypothetical protein